MARVDVVEGRAAEGCEVWVCLPDREPYVATIDRVAGGPTFYWANTTPSSPTRCKRLVKLEHLRAIEDVPAGAIR